jgi:uncharacterized protein (DUF2235 family)
MKRLVVCCDGTWNAPDSRHVTNVEKIARTVETDLGLTGGVQQLVLYLEGVGSRGYRADQVLGGALGLGLFANVVAGYRFLALNFEPGDEVYVFGFSRGAYTARSLAGMAARVGLLTRDALVADQLGPAEDRYRHPERVQADSDASFREKYCHPDTPIRMLGVFDTVGALGVPGVLARRYRFHDVRLSAQVQCARQALATDERRVQFAPCLWEAEADARARDEGTGRVQQVWFPGVHSDVGGGYPDSGLSDTALQWMVTEARRCGLVFDERLLGVYLDSGEPDDDHDSLGRLYRLLNAVVTARAGSTGLSRSFLGDRRRLDPPPADGSAARAVGVRVSSTLAERYRREPTYRHPNLVEFHDETRGFEARVAATEALPRARRRPGADRSTSRPD